MSRDALAFSRVRIKSTPHGFKKMFALPAGHAPWRARRAPMLDRARDAAVAELTHVGKLRQAPRRADCRVVIALLAWPSGYR